MKTYCKASDAQMSGDDLNMTYSGKDYSESVYLTFKKQYDGTFILSHAHPKASDADYTISTVREDEFKKELTVFYNDFKSEDGKLKTVYLLFDTTEDGDTF